MTNECKLYVTMNSCALLHAVIITQTLHFCAVQNSVHWSQNFKEKFPETLRNLHPYLLHHNKLKLTFGARVGYDSYEPRYYKLLHVMQ